MITHKIALNFEDGVTRFIECETIETVADAAYRQGVNLPIDCRDGTCGTCKCHAESGKYEMGFYIEDALDEDEVGLGYVLTCQLHPKSDLVLNIPASSEVCKIKLSKITTTVKQVRRLSDSTLSLTLKGDELNKLSFLPGQYANLEVPGTDQHRAYSFSSMPHDGEVSFLVRNTPNGLMSGYLTQRAKVGDSMMLAGPVGSFYLREITRPLLFLAGGTGLAPFLAMLDKIAAMGSSPRPIHMIYGVNTDGDVIELDKLNVFARQLLNFTYTVCVASEDSKYPKKGYVTQHLEKSHLHDGEVDIYLCGPPAMVEAVAHHLRKRGVQPANFHYEKFATSVRIRSDSRNH
ncbi:MAG: ring-hydroxylating dioxygenase ferredoxin reductase family protein [Candidatus Contendobacter sp.]|nr:ring-hydroxylating dioxygenase ferredoxin reductase family protein [Candidatus Contendobacter sp.]